MPDCAPVAASRGLPVTPIGAIKVIHKAGLRHGLPLNVLLGFSVFFLFFHVLEGTPAQA